MEFTRRTFVATGLASAGVAGLAGCLGGDGGIVLEGEPALPVPVAGDPDADVTVMDFGDFSCPGCGTYKLQIYPFIEESYVEPGLIRYEHRDFPIPAGDWSWAVAGAARSVQDREGDEAFWDFTSEIYTHLGEYSYERIETVADDLGFDGEEIRQDAEEGVYRDDLETERERASDAGVDSTPTIVVDGEEVETSLEDIQEAIDDALE